MGGKQVRGRVTVTLFDDRALPVFRPRAPSGGSYSGSGAFFPGVLLLTFYNNEIIQRMD